MNSKETITNGMTVAWAGEVNGRARLYRGTVIECRDNIAVVNARAFNMRGKEFPGQAGKVWMPYDRLQIQTA